MLRRISRILFAQFVVVILGGCALDPLWWPGFNPIGTAYVDTIPVASVATEVQCEIYEFLAEEAKGGEKNKPLLDPTQTAGVSLILQTDLSGSIQYLGIDLQRLGFNSLSQLVALSNKNPSLQAKATMNDTISAQVDFTVAQSSVPPKAVDKMPPPQLVSANDAKEQFQNVKFQRVNATTFSAVPEPRIEKQRKNYFLPRSACDEHPLKRAYLYLWLKDWLIKYKASVEKQPKFICNTKVTLKTQFKVAVDVSAGVNPLLSTPLLLPISGFNIDASPDWLHSLSITFAMQDVMDRVGFEDHSSYCSSLKGAQPSVVNR
jgi:hypothetical protein